jgi:hypothetical protein
VSVKSAPYNETHFNNHAHEKLYVRATQQLKPGLRAEMIHAMQRSSGTPAVTSFRPSMISSMRTRQRWVLPRRHVADHSGTTP